MKEVQDQLIDFLEKAYQLTQAALKAAQNKEFKNVEQILDNRERALNVIVSLSEKLALYQKNPNAPKTIEEFNNQVSRVIEKIFQMDELITSCLVHEKEKTQNEIAKTFKNKENLKGYNLNNTK